MTNKTSTWLVHRQFISQNNYKLLNASYYLEKIPALITEFVQILAPGHYILRVTEIGQK